MWRPIQNSIDKTRYTIIDEADEMVSPDWVDDMRAVMGGGTLVVLHSSFLLLMFPQTQTTMMTMCT